MVTGAGVVSASRATVSRISPGVMYLSTTSITLSTAPMDNAGMTITAMKRKNSCFRKQPDETSDRR